MIHFWRLTCFGCFLFIIYYKTSRFEARKCICCTINACYFYILLVGISNASNMASFTLPCIWPDQQEKVTVSEEKSSSVIDVSPLMHFTFWWVLFGFFFEHTNISHAGVLCSNISHILEKHLTEFVTQLFPNWNSLCLLLMEYILLFE